MFAFKQNTANKALVGIVDQTSGFGVTGLAYNAAGLSFKVAKSGAAAAAKVLAAPDWIEAGNGWYWVALSAGECDTLGIGLLISIFLGVEGAYPFEIRANLESDVFTRVGAPAGATVSADVAAVKADTAAVKLKTDNLPANPASQTNLDVAVSTRMAAGSFVAPDNATIASTAADVIAIKAQTDTLPSIDAAIDALATAITSLTSVTSAGLVRASDENTVRDQFVVDGDGKLISSRQRGYDTAANAAAAGATGLLYEWTVGATYDVDGALTSLTIAVAA
jgi:hypothetical protein